MIGHAVVMVVAVVLAAASVARAECLEGDCRNGQGLAMRDEVLLDGRFVRGQLVDGVVALPSSQRWHAFQVRRGLAILQRRGYAIRAPLCGNVPCRQAELVVGAQTFEIDYADGRIVAMRPPRSVQRGIAKALALAIADIDASQIAIGEVIRIATLATQPPLTIVIDRAAEEFELVGIGRPAIAFASAKQLAFGWVPTTFVLPIAGPGPLRDRELRVKDQIVVAEPVRTPRRAWREIVTSRLGRIRDDLRDGSAFSLRDARIAAEQARDAATSAPIGVRSALDKLLHALDEIEQRSTIAVRIADIARARPLATRLVAELARERERAMSLVDAI